MSKHHDSVCEILAIAELNFLFNSSTYINEHSCLNQLDYSLGLLGKVKEFSSFDNMRMVLGNEGFDDINLRYMGGMWIMIDFKTEDTKAKFQSCLGATSWFSLLIQASKEFVIDERITWVDIEGIPLKLWSESTFNRIAAKWGKRFSVRAKETMGWIPDFDEQEDDNSESEDEQSVFLLRKTLIGSDVEKEGDNNVEGNDFDVNNSIDPFELYSLLNKKRNVEGENDKSMKQCVFIPPGFTPCDETEVECDKKSMGNNEGSGSGNEKGESVLSSKQNKPRRIRPVINIDFPRTISELKKNELEGDISYQEIKRAVWDCGIDKSPGPDGVTFGSLEDIGL
ncbi:hypothetical protein Tco_0711449 [Tanacetum coccineum]